MVFGEEDGLFREVEPPMLLNEEWHVPYPENHAFFGYADANVGGKEEVVPTPELKSLSKRLSEQSVEIVDALRDVTAVVPVDLKQFTHHCNRQGVTAGIAGGYLEALGGRAEPNVGRLLHIALNDMVYPEIYKVLQRHGLDLDSARAEFARIEEERVEKANRNALARDESRARKLS